MKYIATAIALILMIWTWSLSTEQRAFPLEMHKQVEAGVEQDIRAFIQRKYPATSDIYCLQLYTEVVSAGVEMMAHFRCQATGPLEAAAAAADAQAEAVDQIFEGFLKLKSNDGFQSWSETGGEIRAPEIRFRNGMRISSSSAPTELQPQEEQKAHESHDGHQSHEGHEDHQ